MTPEAARHVVVQMRELIERTHMVLDDMEGLIDAGHVPSSKRTGIEHERLELELFEALADAYEQGRLNREMRAGFVRLLDVPSTH